MPLSMIFNIFTRSFKCYLLAVYPLNETGIKENFYYPIDSDDATKAPDVRIFSCWT